MPDKMFVVYVLAVGNGYGYVKYVESEDDPELTSEFLNANFFYSAELCESKIAKMPEKMKNMGVKIERWRIEANRIREGELGYYEG